MFIKISLASSLLSLILVFASCSSIKVDDTINGGFEDAYDGKNPDGWFANNLPQTKKYAELLVDNSVAHTGNKSILISISNNIQPEVIFYNWVRRIDGLKEGEIYELQGWVKTEKIKNSPFVELQLWNNIQIIGTASTAQSNLITGTKTWEPIKVIFSVPKGTSKILLRAGITNYNNSGGKVWFDDIQIRKIK